MAYKYKLVKENLPGAEDIDSFIDTFTLDPIKELGFPNGLSLRKLVDDYTKGILSPQESEDAEMIIQITLEFNGGFADDDVDNYLDKLNDQRVTSLNEGEDPLQSYLTALLADLKNEQSPAEKAQDEENATLGNTYKDVEMEGRKNLALEVLRRLKNH